MANWVGETHWLLKKKISISMKKENTKKKLLGKWFSSY